MDHILPTDCFSSCFMFVQKEVQTYETGEISYQTLRFSPLLLKN